MHFSSCSCYELVVSLYQIGRLYRCYPLDRLWCDFSSFPFLFYEKYGVMEEKRDQQLDIRTLFHTDSGDFSKSHLANILIMWYFFCSVPPWPNLFYVSFWEICFLLNDKCKVFLLLLGFIILGCNQLNDNI